MAYYDDQDDEQLAVAENGQPTGQESAFLGSGSTVEQGGAASPTQAKGSNPGNFVGIQQYLAANKPQSEKLATQVGQGVVDAGNTARSAVSSAENSFNQDVDKGTTVFNPEVADKVKTSANTLNDQEKETFKAGQSASYGGPSTLQETSYYSPASEAVQKASQLSDQTKTEAGQRELLKPLENQSKNRGGQGINTFDSMLLQAAPNARQELENARQSTADLPGAFQQTLTNAFNKASGAQKATADTAKAYQDALTQGVAANQIDDSYRDWLSQVEGQNSKFEAANSKGAVDPATLAQFGLKSGDQLYDVDLGNFVQRAAPTSMEQFADPEAWARYQALKELGGQFDYALDETQRNKAGTKGSGLDTVNTTGLQQAIANRKTDYDNEMNTYINSYPALRNAKAWLDAYDANPSLNGTGMVSRSPQQIQQLRDYLTAELAPFKSQLDAKYQVTRKA